ncbi:sigma-E factor negative regulatory protein [Massilia sp. erpn]|uniref:sigma-E factor negative regulatory protein n=1 Tax=Massilia sp. erpn TaxID=2738142 RepID=UPI002107499E|nr:sigma-E factor negative regulatory protein [Massilia sp. erpn]UTY58904.1 sigma-E factor negative regulatory protein [Massilia sp. erpn]
MKKSTQLLEHISALMDGELADADRELALAALTADEGRAAWHAYHLIGDQLRASATLEEGASAALAARLRLAVAAEIASEAGASRAPASGALAAPIEAGLPPAAGPAGVTAPSVEDDGAAPAATLP